MLAAPSGALPLAIAAGFSMALPLFVALWLPRSAHSTFNAGRYPRAYRRYAFIGAVTWSRQRELGALLSRVGCLVATERYADAERLLGRIDEPDLGAAERAVWLNNRAYASLRNGGDAQAALVLAEEATNLRPDVPSIQHTRGLALLSVGRIDDAIAVLDAMRSGGELPPRLEAARCAELALAWEKKGQNDYAEDYRARARIMS